VIIYIVSIKCTPNDLNIIMFIIEPVAFDQAPPKKWVTCGQAVSIGELSEEDLDTKGNLAQNLLFINKCAGFRSPKYSANCDKKYAKGV
jgi:hypothetical protein